MPSGLPKNEPRRAQDDPKRAQESPRWSKTRPKATQDDPKSAQEGQKSEPRPQDEKKDRTKTIPRPSWTAQVPICPLSMRSPHLGGQNGTQTDPKTIKNRSEKSRDQKSDPRRSWTCLGAILGRLGAPSWAKKRLKPFILNGFVKQKTLFRR